MNPGVSVGRTDMRRSSLIAAGMLVVCCSRAFALNPTLDVSQYAHTAWTVRDGFGKDFFLSIAQTPDGYLWLGTDSGLLRFGGVRAVSWQPPAGQQLPGIDIPTLLVTRDGALWIGTGNGLARWKDGKLITWAELSGQRISSLLQDREGAVLIGSRAGTMAGRFCAFQNERLQCLDGFSGSGVRSLYEDSRGNLWVGVDNGLWKGKPGRSAFFALPEDHVDGSVLGCRSFRAARHARAGGDCEGTARGSQRARFRNGDRAAHSRRHCVWHVHAPIVVTRVMAASWGAGE
jgi:ligand-binding sensor domain-containing protein